MASLKRTNPATPAQTQVDRRRRQVTARPAGAATDEKTQTADAPSRATSGDRAPMAAADAPYNSSNLQAAVQHKQRRQGERESSGSQSVDQGEHPVPNVEEEQAAAATLRRWHGQ